MQLFVIDWSFENAEDQLFATNDFCEHFRKNKLNEFDEGLELEYMAHTPQNGSGTIICKAQNPKSIFNLLRVWRESYNITFEINPALTNEEFCELYSSNDY
tara:strand:- start:204 stop:506 length:303 start_codon:yes stop_codon:yes gene_type:complete